MDRMLHQVLRIHTWRNMALTINRPVTGPADAEGQSVEPVAGEFAAHGRFDDQAIAWSIQSWLNLHRGTAARSPEDPRAGGSCVEETSSTRLT